MIPPFDIFQRDPGGGLLWRGTAATVEEAKARVREFALSSPGEFLIRSVQSGNNIIVQSDGMAETSSGEHLSS